MKGRLGKWRIAPEIGSVTAVVMLELVSVFVDRLDVIVPPKRGVCEDEGLTYLGGGKAESRALEGRREACMALKLPAIAESGGERASPSS